MRTLRTWLCLIALALVAACGGGGDSAAPPAAAANATTAPVAVTVVDTEGHFVAGATVATGAAQATTDANGRAALAVVVGSEQVVTVQKSGFAEQVKVMNLDANATSGTLLAMIVVREPPVQIAAIEGGGTATGKHGVKVTFPPNALVDAAGNAVTGTVDLSMTPLNVAELDVGAFPGLFEGIPTGGARSAIVTYGTSELVPQQNGSKLQLAAGKTADIELPLYVGTHPDGTAIKAGDSVALWSLNTSTGIWTQEGSGTVVLSAASPTGFLLRATISHFSWWNGDALEQQGFVNLTVTVNNAVPAIAPGIAVPVDGRVVAGSGPGNNVSTTIPLGTVARVNVPASTAVTRLHARFDSGNQVCEGQVDVSPPVNGTVDVTLVASCVTVPEPLIVRPAALSSTNSSSPVTIDVQVNGPAPDSVEVLVDGSPIPVQANGQPATAFPAQFFYRAFWDSSTFGEGNHLIEARATLQGSTRTSPGITVVVDRTRPQMTNVTPPAGSDVDQATTYVVDFDEPVNPLPFTLADVVKLTITPLGQTVPQVLPATIALDTTGQHLTVTAQGTAPLPLGTVGLSWGGLSDAAGNAVTGTLGVTYPVQRHQVVAADVQNGSNFLSFTLDANGVPHFVRTNQATGNLELMKLGPNGDAPLGPAINDRQAGNFSLAIRGTQTLVAFEQRDASGTTAEVVVTRFDAATSTWQVVGNRSFVLANRVTTNNAIRPQVAIDPNGQAVLAFIGSGGGLFPLESWRFDGANWTPIGTFSNIIVAFVLRLDANGKPFIAYLEGTFGSNAARIGVIANTGAAWVPVGGILDSTFDATQGLTEPKLALDAAGRPTVAWMHVADRSHVPHVVQFDGTAFVETPAIPTALNTFDAMTLVGGDPVVTGVDDFRRINVLRLHGGAWEAPVFLDAPPGGVVIAELVPEGGNVLLAAQGQTLQTTRVLFP